MKADASRRALAAASAVLAGATVLHAVVTDRSPLAIGAATALVGASLLILFAGTAAHGHRLTVLALFAAGAALSAASSFDPRGAPGALTLVLTLAPFALALRIAPAWQEARLAAEHEAAEHLRAAMRQIDCQDPTECGLKPRHLEVLRCLCSDPAKSSALIAAVVNKSPHTVDNYIQQMLVLAGCENRKELAVRFHAYFTLSGCEDST